MYHCHLQFYFTGPQCRAFNIIKGMSPLEGFIHEFTESKEPEESLMAKADVILANLHGSNTMAEMGILSACKRKDAYLILLGTKDQMEPFMDNGEDIEDFWALPLSDEEVRFRFLKWQKSCKQSRDFWLTNQYLEAAMSSTPNLVWYKDKEGIHRKVNESFCKTVKKTRAQVEGRDHFYIWDVTPEPSGNMEYDCMESDLEVMSKRKTCISEELVKTGDEAKLLTTYKSPLYDLDGSVMGTVGVGIDITRERAYEQEIIRKNNTLEAVFTTLECGVLCHTIDGTRILSINKAALDILGYHSAEEMMEDGFQMIAQTVLDEDKPKLRACIQSLKKEGEGIGIEYRVLQKNGTLLHVMGNVKLIRENGKLCYQRFLLDCTAEKNREKEKERRQMELIQALSIDYNLVCFFDLDTGIGFPLRSNDSEGFKDTVQFTESMEHYIRTFVYEEDREMLRQAASQERLKSELAQKKIYFVNFRLMYQGEAKYFEMKAVRAGNWDESHGIVLGFRSVDEETRNEIEQKKLLENALLQANQANESKSVFLANMSHEIRTPMNAICGMTDMLLDEELSPAGREYATTIKSSGEGLLSIINDILDFSKIESGKMSIIPVEYYFSSLIHDIMSMMEPRVKEKSVKLIAQIQDDIPRKLLGDVGRIKQILINIIGNATKFTHEGSITFRVTWAWAEKDVISLHVSVIDTGIGIRQENLSKLFDAFEQVDIKKNLGLEGTGLGLSIAKLLVERMGGEIHVESTYGKGSDFSFTILQKVVDSAPCEYNKNKKKAEITVFVIGFTAPTAKVMVVDDNKINLRVAQGLLKKFSITPQLVSSGKECLELLKKENDYDLIFMDHMMPGMDGIDATKAIRSMGGHYEKLPVIALTANAVKGMEQEFLAGGMDDFLAKPIELKSLNNILKKWLPDEKLIAKEDM